MTINSDTYPVRFFCTHTIVVAGPLELDVIFDLGHLGWCILKDCQLEPSPVSSRRVVDETLVVGLGEQLYAAKSLDRLLIENLREEGNHFSTGTANIMLVGGLLEFWTIVRTQLDCLQPGYYKDRYVW